MSVSRRRFLQTGAAGAVTASVAPSALLGGAVAAAAAEEVLGPGPVPIRLDVNGKVRELSVEPRVTLLEALRDHLGITGAKKVCDRASCGACTVHLDGEPVYSCTLLAVEARGRKVVTVESLSTGDGDLHPLQAAFVEHDAQQCGFCTPGFVMAAKALIDRDPDPSDERIDRALGGNLCRCGTYAGMRRAVKSAAKSARRG